MSFSSQMSFPPEADPRAVEKFGSIQCSEKIVPS